MITKLRIFSVLCLMSLVLLAAGCGKKTIVQPSEPQEPIIVVIEPDDTVYSKIEVRCAHQSWKVCGGSYDMRLTGSNLVPEDDPSVTTVNKFINQGWEAYEIEGRNCVFRTDGNALRDNPRYTQNLSEAELERISDSNIMYT